LIKQILVVDDSRLVREAIAKILLSCGQTKSSIACLENGNDALDFTEFYPVDLLICSDNLVDLSATQLVKRLLNVNTAENMLTVVLQQPDHLAFSLPFLSVEHYRIIQKPFNKEIFLSHLNNLTAEPLFELQKESKPKLEEKVPLKVPLMTSKEQTTVLVVDDEPSNIDVASGQLSNIYRVMVATSGKKAIEIVNSNYHKIDLILLDIMMPEVDGYQVCKALKSNSKTADIPIIFLTAKTQVSDITKGFALGAVDYITKPLQGDILRARVAAHISNKKYNSALADKIKTLNENAKLREDIEKITQHDLKGPLSSILFEIDKIADASIGQSIKHSVNNVLNMINNSLDIFKIEQDTYSFNPIETNLIPMVIDAINASFATAKQRGITITSKGLDTPKLILAEPLLCLSIFNNLIKNAVEASPENLDIKIEVKETMGFIHFTIENQGVIPLNIRDTLFEKYVSSNHKQGSGFGTYSAKLMTEVQNGTISFHIKDEKSTEFTVIMPAAVATIDPPELMVSQ